MKKIIKSREAKRPNIAVSMSKNRDIYSRVFSSILKDARIESGIRMVVSRNIAKLIPSIAM
jgi:hypothetical protein